MASKLLRVFVLVSALCAASLLCFTACSTEKTSDKGPVAATLAGTPIYEQDVTSSIEAIRAQSGYTDDATWALILTMSGYTPDTFREAIIKDLTLDQVIPVAATQEGVSIAAADVDAAVERIKTTYGLTDEQWATTLANSGYAEEAYRDAIEMQLAENALFAKVTEGATVTNEYFQENGMSYVQTYYGNIKRASHILFAADNLETAQAVLDQLLSGEIAFEDAVMEYSIDTASAVRGGDVGWSGINTFVEQFQEALSALEVGEMSALVQTQFGYHIILCTDSFVYEDGISVSAVPAEVYAYVSAAYLQQALAGEVYEQFIDGVREQMGFTINPKPEGLSYDVALSDVSLDEGTAE